jgi:hypothetical protein
MSSTRVLSVVLALTAAAFAALTAIASIRTVKVAASWPRVDAVVDEINVSSIGDNKFGAVRLRLRYVDGVTERSAWAYKSLLPSQGEDFVHRYSIGTRHRASINPSNPAQAELEVGWNTGTVFVPLFLGIICGCLVLAARYFWRLGRPTVTLAN